MEITTTMLLLATLIKTIVDAIKAIPAISTRPFLIPIMALVLGALVYPLFLKAFTVQTVLFGLFIGGMAIGAHETLSGITQSLRNSGVNIKDGN